MVYSREYYLAHKDLYTCYNKEYLQRNPDKKQLYMRKASVKQSIKRYQQKLAADPTNLEVKLKLASKVYLLKVLNGETPATEPQISANLSNNSGEATA